MNNLKNLREGKNLTQTELAEKSGVSLRTIQRIEKGGPLKGYTLTSIAKALEMVPDELTLSELKTDFERAKIINLSVLSGMIIPYGGIILPLILTSKTSDPTNKRIGKQIVEVQIVLSAVFSLTLISIPFLQKYFAIKMPLFAIAVLLFLGLKLYITVINGISLNKKNKLCMCLKNSFL